jgi:hypothetical protein
MMSEDEVQTAFDACTTDEERETLARKVGDEFKAEGHGVMDADTLEVILRFCDVAVRTCLTVIAQGLANPSSSVHSIDASMMLQLAQDPPNVVRDCVFGMIDSMGLTVGDPSADPEMTDAALTAMLDGEA